MSVIFGLFNRTGEPVQRSNLQAMQNAFGEWIPDYQSTWADGPAGFGIKQSYETKQAKQFPLPFVDSNTENVFMIEGRLDNRDDLFESLDIPELERHTIADEKLAYLAYLKWGFDCPVHLIGDWSFCLWNPKTQTFFIARDPYGMTALSYYCDANIFAFSSNKRALLALPQIPKEPNMQRIAQTFAFWRGDMEQTAHKGIFRLPPAHQIIVTTRDFSKQRYFFLENTPLLHFSNQEEASAAMLDIYRKAVISRLRCPRGPCLSLSSGLDSSSVGALAAQSLALENKGLAAFTSIPAYQVPSYGDESPLVKEIATMWPNLNVEYVNAEAISPLQVSLDVIDRLAEPIGSTANYYWLDSFLPMAKERGLGAILTGETGNLSMSYDGARRFLSPIELMKRGHFRSLASKIMKPFTVQKLMLQSQFQSKVQQSLQSDFMSQNLLENSGLVEQLKKSKWWLDYGVAKNSKDIRLACLAPASDSIWAFSAERANSYGLDYLDPTRDLRLIQFCLGVPEKFYIHADGTKRALMKHAMKGLLPESVIHQKKRANQSLDFAERLRRCDSDIRDLLQQFEKNSSVQNFIDIPFLIRAWAELRNKSSGQELTTFSHAHFLRAITCAFFIYNFF